MQTGDPLTDLLIILATFWPNVIALVIIWIILIVMSGIITRLLRRKAINVGIPPDAVNGVVLATRLIFLWIGFLVFFFLVPPLWDLAFTVVGGSSLLIGTAVGLAIGQSVRNFVAGLYVMFTNPFDVGDYVRIGTNEGIVLEISLNYTKIRQPEGSVALIPNNNVMNSAVTNFRFRQKDRLIKPEDPDTSSLPRRILRTLSKAIDPTKLVQYTFNMRFPVTKEVEQYNEAFNQICKRWKSKFGFPPVFTLSNISHVAFTYAFTIFVDNPQILLKLKGDFIEDIAKTVF